MDIKFVTYVYSRDMAVEIIIIGAKNVPKEISMARAKIDPAVAYLLRLHDMPFGGKRLGRFTVSRDQTADLLGVAVAHDKTILSLAEAALNDADLVFAQAGRGVYSVVAARKARRWRKVPRAILADLIGETHTNDDSAVEDDESEDAED